MVTVSFCCASVTSLFMKANHFLRKWIVSNRDKFCCAKHAGITLKILTLLQYKYQLPPLIHG